VTFVWEILSHPVYSADISPPDCHIFLSLDSEMRNRKFLNREALETELNNFIASEDHGFYRSGIYKLVSRENIIGRDGDYFSE
jgi:hypothetical protein